MSWMKLGVRFSVSLDVFHNGQLWKSYRLREFFNLAGIYAELRLRQDGIDLESLEIVELWENSPEEETGEIQVEIEFVHVGSPAQLLSLLAALRECVSSGIERSEQWEYSRIQVQGPGRPMYPDPHFAPFFDAANKQLELVARPDEITLENSQWLTTDTLLVLFERVFVPSTRHLCGAGER